MTEPPSIHKAMDVTGSGDRQIANKPLEGGTAHHEEFRQGGRTVMIDYPGEFNTFQMPQPPWGEYRVFWALIHPDGRRDNIEGSFTWDEPGA